MKEQLNRVNLRFKSRFEVSVSGLYLVLHYWAGLRLELNILLSPYHFLILPPFFFFHRYKQLIQVLVAVGSFCSRRAYLQQGVLFLFYFAWISCFMLVEADLEFMRTGVHGTCVAWCGSGQGRGIETCGFLG